MIVNARIARGGRKEMIEHDREVIRKALLEELKIKRESCEHNMEMLAKVPPKDPGFLDVPSYEMSDVYDAFLGRIGLLSSAEVAKVMLAYLTDRQTRHLTESLFAYPTKQPGKLSVPAAKAHLLHDMDRKLSNIFKEAIDEIEGNLKPKSAAGAK